MLCLPVLAGCGEIDREPADPIQGATGDEQVRNPDGQAFADPGPNARHAIAKRSAFPEADEKVTKMIEAKRLSDIDPFNPPIDPKDIPAIVPWQQAGQYLGYEITVEGRVVDLGQSRNGSVNFINFHRDWRGKFYMVMFDDLAKTLEGGVEKTFKGKLVRVKGIVEDHRGRPQIKIGSMDQVTFVQE